MGMMSQAEARLDASIRPEITLLRSRTSYPKRHREAGGGAGTDTPSQPTKDVASMSSTPGANAAPAAEGRALAAGLAGQLSSARARTARAASPIRLTRRGRVVVGLAVAVGVAVLAGLLWLTLGGQARASSHLSGDSRHGPGMIRVVVRPGQTLWSIAVRADPSSDPRVVIAETISDNSLTGTTIQVGQVLWVPRG